MQALAREVFGDDEGSHATASEVAVTQYAFPDTIKHVPLDPPRAPSGRFHGPADYRRRFPDGRIGSNPGLATPEQAAASERTRSLIYGLKPGVRGLLPGPLTSFAGITQSTDGTLYVSADSEGTILAFRHA